MTKKTRNIFIALAVFLVLVIITSVLAKKADITVYGNSVGKVKASSSVVYIDGTPIRAYDLKNMVYIAAEDLQYFNFEIQKNDKKIKINSPKNIDENNSQYNNFAYIEDNTDAMYSKYRIYLNDLEIQGFSAGEYIIIPVSVLENVASCKKNEASNTLEIKLNSFSSVSTALPQKNDVSITPPTIEPNAATITMQPHSSKIIVIDPGHGKSSSDMSSDEKKASGWIYNESRGQWGEWRHWKSGTVWNDCNGSGCSGRVTSNGSCWYPIGNGDRDKEPDINLKNSLAAKKYLEEMGYTVRMTRTSNEENPSITERIKNCYPNKDTSASPDALAYVCIHSNAGGGSGSSYIELDGIYDQAGIPSNYAEAGNALGKKINDRIVAQTSLSAYGNGCYNGSPELILFCKSPVICGYMEIGFFDNDSDLNILHSESDAIGKAIADGINDYFGG